MLQALLAIILIDLSLSADNALIIGLVARDLPQEHRRRAIVVGGRSRSSSVSFLRHWPQSS